MPLPHFTQLQSTNVNFEPVYNNLFEITFILPTLLQAEGRDPILLMENATSVDLPVGPTIGTAEQKFKFMGRKFLKFVDDTTTEFNIKFNVNQDENGSIFNYNTLKSWYDKAWDHTTGATMYKRDLVGTVIVNQHDKQGFIIRRITFHNCQMSEITNFSSLDWGSGDIQDVSAKWIADYWTEEKIDNDFEFNVGNILEE